MSIQVLLLEDDQAFANSLVNKFAQYAHTVHHCDSLQALETWLSSSIAVDLILLDLKLENETSLNSIAQLRQAYPDSKIFMITAYASIATTVEAIKQGADDYLPKPVTYSEIWQAYQGKQTAIEQEEIVSPKRLEWEYIQRVLQENEGNISQTAKQLNMHRRTLQRKLQKKPARH